MKNNKFGFALIGYGGMGGWHTRMLMDLSDIIEIRGIYDIDPARNKKAVADGFNVYPTLEDLLNDDSIDLVTTIRTCASRL